MDQLTGTKSKSAIASAKEAATATLEKKKVDYGRVHLAGLLRLFGIAGILASSSMLVWFLAGLTGLVPTMIDVFGIPGLRVPAGIAISGLLAASIGFKDY